jgi:hypothetical protein
VPATTLDDAGAPTPPAQIAAEPPRGTVNDAGVEPPLTAAEESAPYAGKHKLGVNRVTDMARVGSAEFLRRDGKLELHGNVGRGKHFLEFSGYVEPAGPKKFVMIGQMQGAPDMAWKDEPLRERRTKGRFTFEVRHNRPYWRLYEVNGVPCVCDEGCGNDFCYIDIEVAATP